MKESWKKILDPIRERHRGNISKVLKKERFFPEAKNIYRAFDQHEYEDLKVVILGQDPYHDGSATGLAFENSSKKKRKSPSLINIEKELQSDVSVAELDFSRLAKQGVLFLNTALTVKPGKPNSHKRIWSGFTRDLIKKLNEKDGIVWVLWGNNAKSYKKLIKNETHKFVESVHPSPLSASRGFFGSKPFSRVNSYLKEPIQW